MDIKNKVKSFLSVRNILVFCILFVALIIRLINLDVPLMNQEHDFRQSQTAITVQCFFSDGFDPFHYQVPVFGEPWSLVFECPVYQSLLYSIMCICGATDIVVCGRILSVIIFMLSAIVLWKLVLEVVDRNIADITAIVYLFSPYNVFWSRAILIDYLSVCFALVYTFCYIRYLKKGVIRYFVLALVFGVLAYLQKSTTMFGFVFFIGIWVLGQLFRQFKRSSADNCFLWLFKDIKGKLSGYITVIFMSVLPVIPALFWNHYSDNLKVNGNFLYRSLLNSVLNDWYYGTLQQRLSLDCWGTIINYLCIFSGGPLLFLLLFIVYCVLTKKQHLSILLLSIGAVLFQPLILFNVYYVHTYYYIAVSPFFCLIVGILLNEIIKIDRIRKEIVYFFVFGVACIILFMGSGYLIETFESYTVEDSEISLIENLTDNDDRIIIASGDWNPILLYTVNRKGLMLSHFDGYSFDKVYEEVLADNSEEYTMLVGTETEDLYQVICNYPSNIQFICNTDFVSRLYSDESCPVDSVNSSEWNECDGAVDIDNEQIIRFDRNGNRDADFSNIIIEVDGQEYDRMIILFAPDSDYAYLSTKGFSGSLNIICNDDYITMSCVDCTL